MADLVRGVSYKKEDASTSPFMNSTPLLRATNITGSSLTFDDLVYVPNHYVSPEQYLQQGDIVIASSSGSKEVVGKSGQLMAARERHSFGAFCTGIRPVVDIEPRYLGYYFESPGYRDAISDISAGSSINNIKSSDLAVHFVPIAPRAEQTRIVEKLEELLSDLDAGVAELKAAQRKLAQYRQSLLKAAVEGALTADWRAAQNTSSRRRPGPSRSHDDQPQQRDPGLRRDDEAKETGAELLQRILRERRARWEQKQLAKFAEQGKAPPKGWQDKYPEPAAPNPTDLPPLPQGWVWATVEQLGRVQLGRQRSPSKIGKANPTPYIRAANITENGVDLSDVLEMEFSESEKETFSLKYGDVLLTEASGSPEHVGRPAIWKQTQGLYCFQNTVLRFSPEGICSSYAFYSFLAMQKLGVFSNLSGGVGINHLSAGKFSMLPVTLPPIAEQSALIDKLEEVFSKCDEQVMLIANLQEQLAAQRKKILKSAFSGQLVPQDPNDEPASVLLARIRESRATREKMTRVRSKKKSKEIAVMEVKLIDVLTEAGDWVPAQEAFRRCGVSNGTHTDDIEALYAELRTLDKSGRLLVETVTDTQGRKLHDRLKIRVD